MPPKQTHVIVVAGSPAARDELVALIAGAHVATAASPADVVDLAIPIDTVVVYDLDVDDIERAAQTFARAPSLALVDARVANSAIAALRAGARGVLAHDIDAGELAAAIDAVSHGYTVITPELAAALLPPEPVPLEEPLSTRERDVLTLLSRGVSNREIAAELALSEHTVKFHVGSILAKLGAATRTEAVTIGIRRGLVMI